MWESLPNEVKREQLDAVYDAWRGGTVDKSRALIAAFNVAGYAHAKRGTAASNTIVGNTDVADAFASADAEPDTAADPRAWDLVYRIAVKVIEKLRLSE